MPAQTSLERQNKNGGKTLLIPVEEVSQFHSKKANKNIKPKKHLKNKTVFSFRTKSFHPPAGSRSGPLRPPLLPRVRRQLVPLLPPPKALHRPPAQPRLHLEVVGRLGAKKAEPMILGKSENQRKDPFLGMKPPASWWFLQPSQKFGSFFQLRCLNQINFTRSLESPWTKCRPRNPYPNRLNQPKKTQLAMGPKKLYW